MERTQTMDPGEVLARVLSRPSHPAQIISATVVLLEQHGSTSPVTAGNLQTDLTAAEDAIVGTCPEAVRHTAAFRARSVLPPLADVSRGEYATLLRAAARELG
ncbi:hypothetical protein ABZT17_12140 [Streptomyces sp. NPDC005648]|uniref:hypothetical protein n=1 Tax=Streptomyces sp. NPDC005648 TaxID=3157044 RepID=UPI0033A91273